VPDDGVVAVAVGTGLWALALVVSLLAHAPLAAAGLSWVSWTCAAGIVIGLITGAIVWRRHLVYRAHRASTGQAGQTP
jgi:hypothetical protein